MRKMLLMAPLVLLAGCGHIREWYAVKWPWPEDHPPCQVAACTPDEAMAVFTKALNYCRLMQNDYEGGGKTANTAQFAVGVFGALAGAVAVPIAKGTAATAWGGAAGASNGIQLSLQETFSATMTVNRRARVAQATSAGVADFQAAMGATGSAQKQVVIALGMASNCAMSGAMADQAAMTALSGIPQSDKERQLQEALKKNTAKPPAPDPE